MKSIFLKTLVHPTRLAAFLGAMLAGNMVCRADFSGQFAPANWSKIHYGDSDESFTGSASLTIQGPNDASTGSDFVVVGARVAIQTAGTIHLSYSGVSSDAAKWNFDHPFFYVASGIGVTSSDVRDFVEANQSSRLIAENTSTASSGALTKDISVNVGEYFWIGISSDTEGGKATLTVSGLSFTPVPEPHEYGMVAGVFLLGFAAWRRSRKTLGAKTADPAQLAA